MSPNIGNEAAQLWSRVAPKTDLEFLAGGGEMGERLRALDWSATPLGAVEAWPQSLRTTVSLCLASNFPINVIWGAQHTQIYNDGYRDCCGDAHPGAFGEDYSVTWASAWPVIGESFERALTGETVYLQNQRMFLTRLSGRLEETFFTFSHSPIRDESGRVCGLFHPVTETTATMLSERRTRALRDLSASVALAEDEAQVAERTAEVLGGFELDLPFLLFYRLDRETGRYRLVVHYGVEAGLPATPRDIGADATSPWPFADALKARRIVDVRNVRSMLQGETCGPYDEAPDQAFVMPVAVPGAAQPPVVIVAGASARLPLNDTYRSFYPLISVTLSNALATVRAREDERRRAESLAEIDRAKTLFFSNISHEFRTPLTLMLGPVAEALANPATPVPVRTQLELAHRNALRLLKLVNALLDFSRIEAGRVQASYEPTDLATLTDDLASTFRSAMERAQLTFTVECDDLGAAVYVDREMWEKIVLNLLSNAFKFTLRGSVVVRLRRRADKAELEVSDTGIGVPVQELPRLFERFHRVQGTAGRSQEGSGIGLALVQELVRFHGGTVSVTSELGSGTTFWVRLPFGTAHLPTERLKASRSLSSTAIGAQAFVQEALSWAPEGLGETSTRPPALVEEPVPNRRYVKVAGARILLADDNADMRAYLRDLLSPAYAVESVTDGGQALTAARRERPDLILADIMMPRLDGLALLKALRSDERLRDAPVILLSARAGEESRIEGLDAGADDYLVKPFSARELLARVGALLELTKMRRENEARSERQRQALQRLAEGASLEDVLEFLVRITEELAGNGLLGSIVLLNDAGTHFEHRIGPSLPPAFNAAVQGVAVSSALGICSLAVGRRASVSVPDFRADPQWAPFAKFVAPYGLRAGWSTPVIGSGGRVLGTFANYYRKPRNPAPQDVKWMEFVTHTAAIAIERAHAEAAQGRSRLSLEAADRQKNEFLAMLAHELRNPLAPIRNAGEILSCTVAEDSRAQLAVGIIKRQAAHLTRLVDDLLDVSRITQGRIQLDSGPIDLAQVIGQAVETVHPQLREKRHKLSVTTSAGYERLYVNGDFVRLVQCVVNILSNAVKYTDSDGEIFVRTRAEDASAVVEVVNTGTGIAPELLPRIFDLFVQSERTLDRAQGGLGIGLAVVQRLIEMHGGQIAARSAGVGRGSTFEIRLRRIAPPQTSGSEGSQLKAPRRRVLIVDDSTDAANSLALLLSLRGHQAEAVYNSEQALERIESFQPDVALLDIGLPKMNGYELAQRLRAMPQLEGIRIVALTGYGQTEDYLRSDAAGFDDHLVKPVDLAALERTLAGISADPRWMKGSPD